MACPVRSVSSNLTGLADRRAFDCVAVRCNVIDFDGHLSQPRSLRSIAKLNMARSRVRPSTINRVLIDQTWFGRSGGLAPISLPLFRGVLVFCFRRHAPLSDIGGLL